jgi:murein DD-endopeptidase MepM/ murein hydrolase activator NlpD
MTEVYAAADGTISWVGSSCCSLGIDHDDGWETYYIHLNNDTPGTDDGQGWGVADGILPGTHVQAGQLIGWVGDSGNAEYVSPHLHFEPGSMASS